MSWLRFLSGIGAIGLLLNKIHLEARVKIGKLHGGLLGLRVQRVHPYRERGRSNVGVIIGFYGNDRVRVRLDDGHFAVAHPSVFRVEKVETPPVFQTPEEADAWLERQAARKETSPYRP